MKARNSLYLLLFIALLAGCAPNTLAVKEYINYVQDEANGLKRVKELGYLAYSFQYKPLPYMVALEQLNSQEAIDQRLADLSGGIWFTIQFKNLKENTSPLRYGVASLEEYQSRYNYFLNQASKDIQLYYKGDTLHPMSYVFETNYNLTPVETIIVGFDLPGQEGRPDEEMQLLFFDRIFGNGIIKTSYSAASLHKIPNCTF